MTETTPKIKRSVTGIFLLDKPKGLSSNHALQRVKRLFQAKKAGHTGSLDPLATGLLPICLGEATKYSQYLLSADKTYEVEARLGIRTVTGDEEGEILSEKPVKDYTLPVLDKACQQFRGELMQVPPMYSALKHQGQPLYKFARSGVVVDRPARAVTIHTLELTGYEQLTLSFTVSCTKGTYIRTLVDDLGELLGCGAHVTNLRRTSVGSFQNETMHSLEALQDLDLAVLDSLLIPLQAAMPHLPSLAITDEMSFYFQKGQPIMIPKAPREGVVVLTSKTGQFIGTGEVQETGLIAPKRLCIEAFS